jgi:hypothetical protein
MASKHQMTGMLGVYLVAAELTSHEFIVSVTSRSAAGADLLVTTQDCQKVWTVQVKTNRSKASYWLLNEGCAKHASDTHIYVFVNLRGEERPEYLVAGSRFVVDNAYTETTKPGSIWHSFDRSSCLGQHAGETKWQSEGWAAVFGAGAAEVS